MIGKKPEQEPKLLPPGKQPEKDKTKEGWPRSEFRIEVAGSASEYLKAVKAGIPRIIGVGYYENLHPITTISAELIPGVGDFQLLATVNSIYEKNQAVNFQKLASSLASEYELKNVKGFPVFQTLRGVQFTLENTMHNGFRVVVNGVSQQREMEVVLSEMRMFLESVIEHSFLNCGIFPLKGEFTFDLAANKPKGSTAKTDLDSLLREGQVVGQGRRFADIAGNTKIKKTAQALAEGIRDEERRKKLGIKLPKGILFEGLPGTGKTLMAEAMANEAGCRFTFADSASIFQGGLVGDAERNMKKIFEDALNQPPGVFTIIFFDDLDLIFGSRQVGFHESTGKVMQLVLTYMDGIKKSDNVMIIAATNRKHDVDEALTRPGRFDRHFTFELPNSAERKEILKLHMERIEREAKRSVFGRLDWNAILKATEGLSQAGLASALEAANFRVNEALLLKMTRRQTPVLVNQAVLMEELLRQKASENHQDIKKREIGFMAGRQYAKAKNETR